MKTIIAEKPSVAREIARIPQVFTLVPRQVKTDKGYKTDAGVMKQIKVITRLFSESDRIIVTTDAGREGELIFR